MSNNNESLPGNPGGLGGQPLYAEFERLAKALMVEAQRLHPNGGMVLTLVAPGAQNIGTLGSQTIIYQGGPGEPPKIDTPLKEGKPEPDDTFQKIRLCITRLMEERLDGEPLFNQQNHWQAIYRILVDKGYCRDSDFDGFDVFIQKTMPERVNKPYKKASVKQISQTDFDRPFGKWQYDHLTSITRKPYDRMVAVAGRFKQILEENGL